MPKTVLNFNDMALVGFIFVERLVPQPMFRLDLLRSACLPGNVAVFLGRSPEVGSTLC